MRACKSHFHFQRLIRCPGAQSLAVLQCSNNIQLAIFTQMYYIFYF